MKATMTPMDMEPFRTWTAPTMQTATYPKLPMKPMSGIIMPDRNSDLKALSNRFVVYDVELLLGGLLAVVRLDDDVPGVHLLHVAVQPAEDASAGVRSASAT